MAAWIIPVLRAILPHVGSIIDVAKPVFTKKKIDAPDKTSILLQEQITELQTAATQNAEQIKELAAQLQRTVAALEEAALLSEAKLRRSLTLAILATALSVVAIGAAVWALFARG